LESHIVPLVSGLAERFASGIQMLDVGCGRGRIINRLAEFYPKSRFTGMDLSSEAILSAWQDAADKRLRNIESSLPISVNSTKQLKPNPSTWLRPSMRS